MSVEENSHDSLKDDITYAIPEALEERAQKTINKKVEVNVTNYIFSPALAAFLSLATRRMAEGRGATLFLEGPPGGGKTAFAKAMAEKLGGTAFYYSG